MKKWLLLALTLLVIGVSLFAATTKVAILPLKRLDRDSEYIRKLLTVRDLDQTFQKQEKYALIDMKVSERNFKEHGYTDVDDLQLDEMQQIANELAADILITGNVSSRNQQSFSVSMKLFSRRTGELRPIVFEVGKEKNARWKALDERFMKELDGFVSIESDKLYNNAINFYTSGNFNEAERNLLLVLEQNKDKAEAYYYLGATYAKQKKYPQALQNLETAFEKDNKNLSALRTIVEVYEATNNTSGKLKTMERIATADMDEELWLTIGNIYAEANDIPSAINAFKTALKVNPDYASAKYRLAFLLFDQQQFNDAIEYLEFAFSQSPDNDLISQRLATAYQRANRVDEAISKYEQLIANNPSNVFAYLNVVSLYRILAANATDPKIAADNYQKAINTMTNLMKIQPENGLVYLNLASIYLAQNKSSEAETNANTAISKDANLFQAYIIQAMVQQTRGTEKYNQFVDLEKRAAAAVGRQATNLGKERDAAKAASAGHFRKADELLRTARSRTNDPEVTKDINDRLARVAQLLNQATSY